MLETVKLALRINTNAFDSELLDLVEAAKADLKIAGVDVKCIADYDPMMRMAIVSYCKVHFGDNESSTKFKRIYDEIKSQMRSATGYTDWGDH